MASKQTRLEVNVVATDNASKVIADVADDVREIEGDHEVDVTVADNASRKLDAIADDVRELDGSTPEVDVTVDDNASRKLDAIADDVRELDGRTVDIDVTADGIDSVRGAFAELTGGGGGGGLAAAGKAGLIGGAVVGVGKLVSGFADAALQAETLRTLIGGTVEDASRLLTVWTRSGQSADDLVDIILQTNDELDRSPELAAELGVALDDGKTSGDRFLEVVGKLNSNIDDTGRRGVIATQLFGQEGVRQVAAITTEVGDLQAAVDGVSAGHIVTDADVERARQFKAEWRETKGYIDDLAFQLGQILLPVVNGVLDPAIRHSGGITAADLGYGPTPPKQIGSPGLFQSSPTQITIVNPPGTPAMTAEHQRVYDARNGTRP